MWATVNGKATVPSSAIDRLRADVDYLAGHLGSRNDGSPRELEALHRSADFVARSFEEAGLDIRRHVIDAKNDIANIETEIRGRGSNRETIVIGAHYDTARGAPGADDNASGVAALLAIARELAGRAFSRTVRLVAFANEEPPHTRKPSMGSRKYARALRQEGVHLSAMISLEMLGYYVEDASPEAYAWPMRLVPWRRGDFVMVVGNLASYRLARAVKQTFGEAASIPIEALALPGFFPLVKSSDHWSFWKERCPAVMIADMGPLRNPHYHTARDLPATLDFDRFSRTLPGLCAVVADLADAKPQGRSSRFRIAQ